MLSDLGENAHRCPVQPVDVVGGNDDRPPPGHHLENVCTGLCHEFDPRGSRGPETEGGPEHTKVSGWRLFNLPPYREQQLLKAGLVDLGLELGAVHEEQLAPLPTPAIMPERNALRSGPRRGGSDQSTR
ncbi:hypothetical protein [Paractinoplanes hotanensis]|uniref:hypothetical protein n=1 Tax=Paractinoplanes hotanensis TaxID=2906497 RepID=UPI002043A30D|nr:hypothetical protein [Actinoplanes hotanensis]